MVHRNVVRMAVSLVVLTWVGLPVVSAEPVRQNSPSVIPAGNPRVNPTSTNPALPPMQVQQQAMLPPATVTPTILVQQGFGGALLQITNNGNGTATLTITKNGQPVTIDDANGQPVQAITNIDPKSIKRYNYSVAPGGLIRYIDFRDTAGNTYHVANATNIIPNPNGGAPLSWATMSVSYAQVTDSGFNVSRYSSMSLMQFANGTCAVKNVFDHWSAWSTTQGVPSQVGTQTAWYTYDPTTGALTQTHGRLGRYAQNGELTVNYTIDHINGTMNVVVTQMVLVNSYRITHVPQYSGYY